MAKKEKKAKERASIREIWDKFVVFLGSDDQGNPHGTPREQAPEEDNIPEERFIQRTSLQARLTHDVVVVTCCWLIISGLFVLNQQLGSLIGAQAVFVMRMSHRVIGMIFVIFPIISAILAPKGVKHIGFNLFHPWNKQDWIWMAKFMPYLFACRHVHMPDQDYTKSGQRFADGMMWLCCFAMAISGIGLLLGDTILAQPDWLMLVWHFVHDLFFLLICVFGMAHAFLGGGFFQPYKGTARIMWGDGKVPESDALYHWGNYARREIADGRNIYVLKSSKKKASK